MDESNIKNIIQTSLFQQYPQELIDELHQLILQVSNGQNYFDIRVVGSRIIGGFRIDSDLDIFIIGEIVDKPYNLFWHNVRVSIHFKKATEEIKAMIISGKKVSYFDDKINISYKKFSTSYYSLTENKFVQKPDDEKYIKWKNNGYIDN